MKILKVSVFPLAMLIIITMVLIPIISDLYQERCHLSYNAITETDLLGTLKPEEILAAQPEHLAYLMKHPEILMKLCLNAEQLKHQTGVDDLNRSLAQMAFKKLTGETLQLENKSVGEALAEQAPKLAKKLSE